MSAPRYDLAGGRHSRLWSSRLWILAALLGLVTMFHMVGIVHDTRAWRAAIDGVVMSTAERHAERLNERLQLYALESFSPLVRSIGSTGSAGNELDELARVQRAGEECNCRAVLPVAEFFRFDFATRELTRKASGGRFTTAVPLADSLLSRIARADSARPRRENEADLRLTLGGPSRNHAVVTTVRRDSAGNARVLFGLIADAHPLMSALFNLNNAPILPHAIPSGAVRLDTQSFQISGADSAPLFGSLADDRPYRAKVFLHGPMDGLGVSVAMASSQTRIGQPFFSQTRLWALGALLASTVLVIIIAVTTSRREMFLARARSDFIAGTSHDLRMPLAQILLAGETLNLRPEVDANERHDMSTSIVRETRRLIAMVENVLLFSRSGAVEIKPVLRDIPVAELFEDVRDSVQLAADDNQQTIEIAADAVAVRADRQLLRQAFVNLVDNAMKYGKPHQIVRLGAVQRSPGLVHLWVDDEGPGIPPAQRARVFEPYERLTRDQVSEHAGSGLGLAVVNHIAKVCGGKVWVTDAPTGGARVVMELESAST